VGQAGVHSKSLHEEHFLKMRRRGCHRGPRTRQLGNQGGRPVRKTPLQHLAILWKSAVPPSRSPQAFRLASKSQELSRTLRWTLASKRATLTTTRSCRPSPIGSRSSRASTRKVMVRPSTAVTSAVAVTRRPTGVAAK